MPKRLYQPKKKKREDSDSDICIVSPVFGKDYFDENVRLRILSVGVDSRIEPVAFHPIDINDKYDSLASEIKKYGIILTSTPHMC